MAETFMGNVGFIYLRVFRVIRKRHIASFPARSFALYVTSCTPGTGKRSPECLLEVIVGGAPESSIAVGSFQVMRIVLQLVMLSFTKSLGQFVNTGGCKS